MKKIFTTLFLVSLSISGLSAAQSEPATNYLERQVISETAKPMKARVATTAATSAGTYAPATAADLSGKYIMEGYFLNPATNRPDYGVVCVVDITPAETANEVYLNGFIFEGLNPSATYDPAKQTLTISKDKEFPITDSTTKMSVYQYNWNTKGNEDIVLYIDPASHNITYIPVNDELGASAIMVKDTQATSPKYAFYQGNLFFTNSAMQTWDLVNGQLDNLKTNLVNIYRDPTDDSSFYLANFANLGFEYPIRFSIDPIQKTAFADDALFVTTSTGVDFYFWNFDTELGIAESTSVGFQGERQDDGSWVFIGGIVGFLDSEGQTVLTVPVNNTPTPCIYYSPSFLMPFDPFTSGVESIEIDNSSAPVEYFNLQGMRISEPTAGMYIRRQGNKSEKVIKK